MRRRANMTTRRGYTGLSSALPIASVAFPHRLGGKVDWLVVAKRQRDHDQLAAGSLRLGVIIMPRFFNTSVCGARSRAVDMQSSGQDCVIALEQGVAVIG